ncbi:MAG: FxLYD domain-containing protein [Candidatus Sulfopaludibacter sp.]|nr:FxLYD domain-containing protein [Candidatus Sulfopaludibacter sp.]
MKRLRQIFESIFYAGLKPRDPFYLSNRTTGQRIRLAALIAIPFLAVLGGVALAAMGYFDTSSRLPPPAKPLSNAEIAAKMLPDLNKDIRIETNQDLQVLDVVVGRGRISGSVKNATTRVIGGAEVIFELTNARGSRVGAVSCRFARLAPGSSTPFLNPIAQTDAAYAVVREVHSQ